MVAVSDLCHCRAVTETQSGSMRDRTIRNQSLRGSRFIGCDFVGVVVRGSEVAGMEIESHAELNRRFPGRQLRDAQTPEGLSVAWAALEQTWQASLDRALGMPPGTLDTSVANEWSFTQTLRHLVMATDTWLGKAILERTRPYHPVGLPNDDDSPAYDASDFADGAVPFSEVLEARADRQAMVRGYIASVTAEELAAPRKNPHAPDHPETVLSCLRTILEEEWEHHRYAVRDLDVLAQAHTTPT